METSASKMLKCINQTERYHITKACNIDIASRIIKHL